MNFNLLNYADFNGEVPRWHSDNVSLMEYSLKDLIIYFLKLGTTGFGGPVALVGYMHRDLVEKKQWFTEDEYKEGLALSQLAQLSPDLLSYYHLS